MYRAILDNPELMSCRLAGKVRMGVPRHAATGQRIYGDDKEPVDWDCLGFYLGDLQGW